MNNYHDYVIKNGAFVGRFEEMYADCDDPWHQSEQPNKYARSAGILHLQNYNIKSLLECGCGLGYYANWIYESTGIVPKSVDISKSAIEKAKTLFPHLDFEVADISRDLIKYKSVDCVMFAEIMWYILPELKSIINILEKDFKGRYIIVNQVFYKGSQKYGNEYFTSLEEFIAYMPFELIAEVEATAKSDTTIETSTLFKVV